MGFGSNKSRLEDLAGHVQELSGIVEQNSGRISDLEARMTELEDRIHTTLDGLGGYKDMTRDELLRVQGALDVQEETLSTLIEWASSEDYRERVARLRFRFRHHQTRSNNALARLDD